jgi:hypothetical protein
MIQISGVFRLPSDGALAAFAETTPDFTLFGVRLLAPHSTSRKYFFNT